jgi:hypothetical protein
MILTQYDTQIFISTDTLMSRKLRLAQQTQIPDMQAYAEEWNKLAADFEGCGLMNNAADCIARYEHYKKMSGTYLRRIEMPFAELIPFQDMTEEEKRFITVWIV